MIRLRLHLLTEARTAVEKSLGESSPTINVRPMSSCTVVGPSHFHLKRFVVAISAVEGPVTLPQMDLPTMFNLDCASVIALVSESSGNHCSQNAKAQYLIGPSCASNAGSAAPPVPSTEAQTKSTFLPPALAEHALATAARMRCNAAQLMPMHYTE